MASMIKKKESDMSNFQVAAGTLDASTKIYAYRSGYKWNEYVDIPSLNPDNFFFTRNE